MIRWPQDALIFSVKVRGCGVYAAGYVEGDTHTQELLGARQTEHGLELVALRGVYGAKALAVLRATRSLSTSGIAPALDAFIARGPLQPESVSSIGSSERYIVVVERLPADVHLADLSRRLFRRSNHDARPPVGLALYVVREVARIYAAASSFQLHDDERGTTSSLHLTRRAANILLAWDGTVHVQPRIVVVGPHEAEQRDDAVLACGRHLLRLLSCEIPDVGVDGETTRDRIEEHAQALPGDVSLDVAHLVRAAVAAPSAMEPPLSLQDLLGHLDELLADEPFSSADLAGTLAQLFADEREQDLSFREELAACDLDALTLPEVKADDVDVDAGTLAI